MSEAPTPRPTREERMAKLAAARAAAADRTEQAPEGESVATAPDDSAAPAKSTRPARRPRAASGARVVVSAVSVAGFTVMTQAMGPIVASEESEPASPQPAVEPTTQPSVVVRLVDENGNLIPEDAGVGSGSDMGVISTAKEAGLLEADAGGPATEAGAADAPQPQSPAPPVGSAPASAPAPAPAAAPVPAPVAPAPTAPPPTAPPATAAPPPPPPTTAPPPPRSSASG